MMSNYNRPSKVYVESVRECAKERNRTIYIWERNDCEEGSFISSVHLSMVPFNRHYWAVNPNGSVILIW